MSRRKPRQGSVFAKAVRALASLHFSLGEKCRLAANSFWTAYAALIWFSYLSVSPALADNAQEPWEGAYSAGEFGGGVLRQAYCDILGLMQGNLGAMLASAAAVMLLVNSAFGKRQGGPLIITAVGAVTLGAGVSLYFGDFGCSR